MRYSIIVVFNNNYALMSNFLENLLSTVDENDSELILYSDGCKDYETIQYLQKKADISQWIRLILSPQQQGYSIANNCAVSKSTAEYLVFMNSDVFPENGSVDRLVDYVSHMDMPGAAQGRLIYPQNMLIQSTGHLFCRCYNGHVYTGKAHDDPLVLREGTRQALTTAFCAMPRNLFWKYGGFNERYYNAYEGMELTLKISHDGGKCLYCPDCAAYHATGATRGFVSFDDEMPGRYFWSTWSQHIQSDLASYLRPQITETMREPIYFHIESGTILEWPSVLRELGISFSGTIKLEDRFSRNIELYRNLPFSSFQYGAPYLFTVNDLSTLKGNKNWAVVRGRRDDLVLDGHGNVAYLYELTGANGNLRKTL